MFLLTSSGHIDFADEYMIFFQAESLVLNQSPAVPQARQFDIWYGTVGVDGEPHAGFGLTHPLVIAPFYGLGKLVGYSPGIPVRSRDLIHYMAAIGSSSFFAALLVCLFYHVLSRLGVAPRIAFTASLVLAFATPVWPYTGTLFSEIWTALLLLTALAALERETGQEQGGILPVVVCGLCLGLALMTRPNHGAAFPVFGLALLLGPGSTLVCLFYHVLSRLGVAPRIAFTASLVLAFATPVWPYTGTLFSEIWTALLLLTALAALERETGQEQGGILPVVLCGLCLGLALMTRPNHGAAFPVFGLALLLGSRKCNARSNAEATEHMIEKADQECCKEGT